MAPPFSRMYSRDILSCSLQSHLMELDGGGGESGVVGDDTVWRMHVGLLAFGKAEILIWNAKDAHAHYNNPILLFPSSKHQTKPNIL